MFGICTYTGHRNHRSFQSTRLVILTGLVALTGLGWSSPTIALQLNLNKLGDVANALVQSADGLKEITEEREIELGQSIAARLLGAVRLDTTPGVQAYVNRIGHWLVGQTERPNLPWRFGVLDTSTVNAFAAPGGHVFITRGLLLRMTSEAELAGVLGHEIAHVLKRHHLEAIRAKAQRELAVNLVSAMADNNNQIMNALIGSGMELYSRGLDREDEYEADLMGVVIAARGGYSAYGLPVTLMTLGASNPSDGATALFFSTHPPPAERLDRLEGYLENHELGSDGRLLESRFEKSTKDLSN